MSSAIRQAADVIYVGDALKMHIGIVADKSGMQ